mgnify:CR=1 FL=1
MAKVSIETNAKDVKRRLGLFKSRHIPICLLYTSPSPRDAS